MLRELCTLFLVFTLFAFLGWLFESIFCSISEKRFINRGFLNGPVCPIYGVGALVAWLFLAPIQDGVLLFCAGAIGCSIIEYITSWAMEAIYHTRWWDYSDRFLNLNGRVCLPATLLFGSFTFIIARWMKPPIEALIDGWASEVVFWTAGASAFVFVLDIVVTNVGLSGFRDKVDGYCDKLTARVSELYESFSASENVIAKGVRTVGSNTVGRAYVFLRELMPGPVAIEDVGHDLAQSFQAALNFQERRVMDAFPNMRVKLPKLPKIPSKDELIEWARAARDNMMGR